MKFALVIAGVLVAVWIWRNNRESERNDTPGTAARRPASPAPMVACTHCGMHLPQDEAVRVLRHTIESKNLPHLLFYGPPGTGTWSSLFIICAHGGLPFSGNHFILCSIFND